MSERAEQAKQVDEHLHTAISHLLDLQHNFGKYPRKEIQELIHRAFWHAIQARDQLYIERDNRTEVGWKARAALAMANKL
jgi:hypothetical protein